MIDADQFSTEFAQEHRLMSRELDKRAAFIRESTRRVTGDRLITASVEELVDEILSARAGADDAVGDPANVGVELLPLHQDLATSDELRGDSFGERIPSWRWDLRFRWSGPRDLFGFWPDDARGLDTFDNHRQLGRPPCIKWDVADRLLTASCLVAKATPHPPDDDDAALLEAIWDDEQTRHPADIFERALSHVELYCDAANRQLGVWRAAQRDFVRREMERLQTARRRGRLNRDIVQSRLGEWRVGPLELEPPPEVIATATPAEPKRVWPHGLNDATITDIVQVANRWAHAVEKYPAAFIPLEEERISDLLVATLNGAFGRAEREVFIGGGRTDFSVQASTFGLDGVADLFAGEAKFWSGEENFLSAVRQSLTNLVGRTKDAILLILVRNRSSFSDAVATASSALLNDPQVRQRLRDRAGRPTFEVVSVIDGAASVSLTVMFVDLTRPAELRARPKGRKTPRPRDSKGGATESR